jgi:membrane protease YdiL (CAAX protease family)
MNPVQNITPEPERAPGAATRPNPVGVVLRVGVFILIGWLGMMILPALMYPLAGIMVASALATFAAAALANAISVRIFERGRMSDLGLGWSPTAGREFGVGMGAGVAAAVLILGGSAAVGIAGFVPSASAARPWASLAFVSATLLFGAAGEEMLFHGYAFQLLIRSFGGFQVILPASILFGAAHLGNPSTSALGIVNTTLWGILLGYAYLRSRALWLPIGLHFGWNVTLPLFGANLSGFTMGVTGYALTWEVGDLWSGGQYGPEGSLLTTLMVVVLFFAVRRLIPAVPQ